MRPYVIHSPGYCTYHGGIRVLHRLCHELNEIGVPACVHTDRRNAALNTPPATAEAIRDGIVIYPEIVTDNPLGAQRVVRWLLNRSEAAIRAGGYIVSFSRMIDSRWPILNVLDYDPELFHVGTGPRECGLFWVGKGTMEPLGGEVPAEIATVKHWTFILRDWPIKHTDYADLLREGEILVSYDTLSGVNHEAALCGTPVVIVPNGPYQREDIAMGEMGLLGIAWGFGELDRARATLPEVHPRLREVMRTQRGRIWEFVQETQARWP